MKFSNKWFNKKFFFGFVFLVLLLAIIDWLIYGRTPAQEIKSVTEAASGFYGAAKAHAESASVAAQALVDNFQPAKVTEVEFKKWFQNEVKIMNQFNVNEDSIRQRYLQVTSKMTPQQFGELAKMAKAKTQNVSEKILAAYLLAYAGHHSVSDLAAFAASDIELDGSPNAHSVAETQLVQERALRVLAINRLAELEQTEELKKLIPTIKDSSLKNYAQNKLNEISQK